MEIKNLMNNLLKEYSDYKKEIDENYKYFEGSLIIEKNDNRTNYYHNLKNKKVYIRKNNYSIIKGLAQKTYYNKILRIINSNIKAINKFNSSFNFTDLDEVYVNLSESRKNIVSPLKYTWTSLLHQWNNIEYPPLIYKDIVPNIDTMKGDKVRSKSERLIADTLYQNKIPYHYEYPLQMKNGRAYYPDFCILSKKTRRKIYMEHFGRMDEPGYAEKAVNKIIQNQRNGLIQGINILYTFETSNFPLNQETVLELINNFLI